MNFTLARIEKEDGTLVSGTRGISCFFMRIKDDNHSEALKSPAIYLPALAGVSSTTGASE